MRKGKYAPETQEDYDKILLLLRACIKDKKIKRGAAKLVAEELNLEKKVVDFVLKDVKASGEYDGIAKVEKKAKEFDFIRITPSKLIQGWIGLKNKDKRMRNPKFWSAETKFLRDLCSKYPHRFIETLRFPMKVDSLVVLTSDFHKKFIERKYKEHTFELKKEKPITVGDEKLGEKLTIKKKKSIQTFLNNGKK